MKELYITIMLVFTTMAANCQVVNQNRAYRYDIFVTIDSNYSPIERLSVSGVIVFSEVAEEEFISVTTGEEITYNGPVKTKKLGQRDGNELVNTYLFTTEFQGYHIPIQLFEIYDLSKSSVVPQKILLCVHNMQTGEYVQGQSYENITRIR